MPKQKNNNETKNAVIYARFSSHNQSEQSIEGQLRDCHAFAEREGYTVIHEYIDRAKSARSDDRPDFQRMIKDAAKKQFQYVIVWKLDRFARNRYDSAIYKAKLKKYGIKVLSVMENITDSPEGIILEGMLESLAEFYSVSLGQNVKRGQRETVAKGKWCGGQIPYGYQAVDGRLVENPRTAPVIRELFTRYAQGERKADIIKDFNRRGYRTANGTLFKNSSFQTTLKNPVYIGNYQWKGETVEGCADALIDEHTFYAVQSKIKKRATAPASAKAKEEYLLQGKVFCGMCGSRMIGESGYGKMKQFYQYYTCANRKNKHSCQKRNEKKDFIEWYVVEQTLEYVLSEDRIDYIAEAVVKEYDKEFDGNKLKEIEKRIAQLEADLNKCIDGFLSLPKAAQPQLNARIEALGDQKADLEQDAIGLRLAAGIRYTKEEVIAWLKTFCNGDPLDMDFRRRIIDVFINSVYLYDDKVVIFYNIKGGKQVSFIEISDEMENLEESSSFNNQLLPNLPVSEPFYIFVGGILGIVLRRTD